MKLSEIPAQHCPRCNRVIRMATSPTQEEPPVAGDFSVCTCGCLLRFNTELIAIPATPEELVWLHEKNPEAYFILLEFQRKFKSPQWQAIITKNNNQPS